VLGPGEQVRPPVTERLDFELEIAVVVGGVEGSDGTDLTPDAAASHIFGYTIMNDWSARDLQAREMKVRLGPAKGKDFGTSLGPWIVTADELAPFLDADGFLAVRAEVFVNGVLTGQDLVSNMGWPFPELVAYAARNSRVVPGDVLGSGTVGNGGCLGELWGRAGGLTPPPLGEGDEVRMVVEGIGELTARVGAAVVAPPLPAARRRSRQRSRI
jgi:2-keto-4-pentenoate hydratase/2-oxohepta-3-ene-1,7-dioic acid hydratase in catechol pathway